MKFIIKSFRGKKASSRSQINIREVRDGILVLPNDKYRMILETSSINFELKSEKEQDAIIESFQNFLNSLPCTVQILIKVREVDIQSYVENFLNDNNHETKKIYKDQLKNYADFIKKLVSGNKIMTRKFYIVIPNQPVESKTEFTLIKEQLQLNVDIITKGLEKLGMKTRLLGNIEILELFYSVYNSTHVKTQPLNEHSFKELFNSNYVI